MRLFAFTRHQDGWEGMQEIDVDDVLRHYAAFPALHRAIREHVADEAGLMMPDPN